MVKYSGDSKVVPFGKYRGQRVADVVDMDPGYLVWAEQQPRLVSMYPQFFSHINSTVTRSEATPAHNTMQVRFLDDDYRRAFAEAAEIVLKIWIDDPEIRVSEPQFEVISDVSFAISALTKGEDSWWKPLRYMIELKPLVGDDFPVVLRQIKAQQERFHVMARMQRAPFDGVLQWVLFIGEYAGQGATLEQMCKLFAREDIRVVMKDDVDLRLLATRTEGS